MRTLQANEIHLVGGGEFIPGWPTPDMLCLNVMLMISAGRGGAGFDISAAVRSLMKYCQGDFWDLGQAHEFVLSGAYP